MMNSQFEFWDDTENYRAWEENAIASFLEDEM